MAVYVCSIEHSQAGQALVCVVAFALTDTLGAETPGDAATVAGRVATAWGTNIKPAQNSSCSFQQVTARGMIDGAVSAISSLGAGPGSQNTAALPTFVAGRVQFQTATPGRAGRGRTGIPGLSESQTQDAFPNLLQSATVTDFQSRINLFISDIAAGVPTITPCVVSRYKGTAPDGSPLPRPGGPIASIVTSTQVLPQVGSRVSRLR